MIANCKKCGRESHIEALGLCKSCYVYFQVKRTPESYKKQLIRSANWQKKNLKYWRDYYHKHKTDALTTDSARRKK